MGVAKTPIKGTIEVTDRVITTIDGDLGWLERMIPATTARESIRERLHKLLT